MSSYFFLEANETSKSASFIKRIKGYAETENTLTYLIDRPLGDIKYDDYKYKDGLILLIPRKKIVFINCGERDNENFLDFTEDILEDLSSISDKYLYKNVIGRLRNWRNEVFIENVHIEEIDNISSLINSMMINDEVLQKKSELLTSLFIGSINDIYKVKDNVPSNILDRVKQKIILFDAEQTRFIYDNSKSKRITIQGLSGTGKTELLLHKLKDLYIKDSKSKIFITCHNKILANNLRNRIPEFFNFMKVEQQILWNERLWCNNAWGRLADPNSGLYRYLTHFYNLTFFRFATSRSFKSVCENLIYEIKKINKNENFEFALDYIIIDESQDFDESFFELCELVVKNKIYVGGDIFQSIFDNSLAKTIKPDFLLGKCYRTDPKTLMFAHALGMGLFEEKKLRWLEEEEWKHCGYIVNIDNDKNFILSREPLRRFEDIEDIDSMEIVRTFHLEKTVINIIDDLIKNNETILPEDIAIIFLDKSDYIYEGAKTIGNEIKTKFGFDFNIGFETKEPPKNEVFITNRNNVKGLEFPFVICVTLNIIDHPTYRNSLYTMLTRSFIKSYLIIPDKGERGLTPQILDGLNEINKNKKMIIKEPSEEEKIRIKTEFKIRMTKNSEYDLILSVLKKHKVSTKKHDPIIRSILDNDLILEINEEFIVNYLKLYNII